ncbi:hypothetical protein ARHIZOSPH14_06640 [Agromyces rhizosphaerae]|uniref:DUF4240 domain-containing protein n=2 Tax=Agromyces rhizosphaerae TaxID=88374 RepID=A0A9W6CWB0_9MICO|nr:hypothetical protein ARHIZOSPH14_06640 [Agromyces rhizosphaerae]
MDPRSLHDTLRASFFSWSGADSAPDPAVLADMPRAAMESGHGPATPRSLMLAAEWSMWVLLGTQLGILDGLYEPEGMTLEFGAVLEPLVERARAQQPARPIESEDDFFVALSEAFEDLTPDRLAFVDTMIRSSILERDERTRAILGSVVRSSQADDPVVAAEHAEEVAWAFGGRGSALGEWDSPALWRSNAAVDPDAMTNLHAAMAIAAMAAGPEYYAAAGLEDDSISDWLFATQMDDEGVGDDADVVDRAADEDEEPPNLTW